jgi:hypothetical protein
MTTSNIPWLSTEQRANSRVTEADEFLHPAESSPDFTLTETYWFTFCIPERNLNGNIYIWMHKNLNTCTSGVWIWRGFKSHHLQCEHFNVQSHLPYPTCDGRTVSVPHLGLSINIVKPLKTIDVTYQDGPSGNSFQLRFVAVMSPAVRGNGKHFEQALKVTGKLNLNGELLPVDCFSVRDRSWGQGRSETPHVHPPITWSVGVLDSGRTAFNVLGSDDPKRHPDWEGIYDIKSDAALRDGWLWKDGVLRRIVRMSQFTERNPKSYFSPVALQCEFEDDAGANHLLMGKLVNSCPWGVWPNLHSTFALMEWTLDGVKCYGEINDMIWIHHFKKFG